MPVEIPGQDDVFPPERRRERQEGRIERCTCLRKMADSLVPVAGIPKNNGGQLTKDCGRFQRLVSDAGRQPHDIVPMLPDNLFIDRPSHVGK